MTLREVKSKAAKLKVARLQADEQERSLISSLDNLLSYELAKAFADSLDVSQQYLSDIRNGRRKISDEVLERLCGMETS